MPTEKEIIEQIEGGKILLPPLLFRMLQLELTLNGNRRLDALIEVSWGNRTAKFAVEWKSISTPKAFQNGIDHLKSTSFPKDCYPMIIMPFLNEKQLSELEREEISGVDLSGNGVVIVPGVFAVFRSGAKNLFPSSSLIKNIYRLNSSMVARVFLSRSRYDTVQDIWEELKRRNILANRWSKKPMSLSTVSKSLKTLEEDLIVERKEIIRLQQPDKLLEQLSKNYMPPKIKQRVRLKVFEGSQTIRELLNTQTQELGLPFVATGTSSVGQYAVMQRGELISVYCPSLKRLLEKLSGSQSDRFPNLELFETEDETVFFDARQDGNFWWASPVQAYLELMAGDKRDRDTSEQVKSFLLKELEQVRR